eukprot:GILJ01013059.1.p1 GENE.GILJ01013059.1~~GILJ01013059.1.p1  ORF type:complete len:804 (+),score=82.89 GILJ01013059.1:315-2414(+)
MPPAKSAGVPMNVYLLHALTHIELGAIDMYWDTMVRSTSDDLPHEFFGDFLTVVGDEARHFMMLTERLKELSFTYGVIPAQKAFWDNAVKTRADLAARLAILPLVQESRGLDAGPRLVEKLLSLGDKSSAAIVKQICEEEVNHVRTGLKWFKFICAKHGLDAKEVFQRSVLTHLDTVLHAPFNVVARSHAGLPEDWYLPVSNVSSDSLTSSSSTSPSSKTVITYNHRKLDRSLKGFQPKTSRSFSSTTDSTAHCGGVTSTPTNGESRPRVMFIVAVWPDLQSSAAGMRTASMVQIMHEAGWDIMCLSSSNLGSTDFLRSLGVTVERCQPNDSSLDAMLKFFAPTIVIFDRFYLEEQFSWKVRSYDESILRILDTQDLHFLRQERQRAICNGKSIQEAKTLVPSVGESDIAIRELSAIHRSDLVLLVSPFEQRLLTASYGISVDKVAIASFFYGSNGSANGKPFPPVTFSRLPSFDERAHFTFIGNFRHAPNVDAAKVLYDEIWPRIRAELPAAEVHLFGAYANNDVMKMNNRSNGFHVRGFTANQFSTLSQFRVQLVPLRFGAGIKGKIADGWYVNTPCVTTSIGQEGMFENQQEPWGGEVSDVLDEFAGLAVLLHNDETRWVKCVSSGQALLSNLYNYHSNGQKLLDSVVRALHHTMHLRRRDSVGPLLWHNSNRASEYQSKFIELRNQYKSALSKSV